MAKKKLVNAETQKNVQDYLSAVKNAERQADAIELVKIMKEVTGKEAKMWGRSIIGFGKHSYQRKNGDEFEWFNVGLSPTSKHLSVYVMFDLNEEAKLLEKLGKHGHGKGCLHIKSLEDVNMNILKKIIAKSDKRNS